MSRRFDRLRVKRTGGWRVTTVFVAVTSSILVVAPWTLAQVAQTSSFRSYQTSAMPAAQAADKLRAELGRRGLTAEIVPDNAGHRLLVSGSPAAQAVASEFAESLRPKPQPNANDLSPVQLKAYPVPADILATTAAAIRKRYGSQANVRIGTDQRTHQILVHGPAQVQSEIESYLAAQANPTTVAGGEPPASTLDWSGGNGQRPESRLKNVSWQQLFAAIESAAPNRLSIAQSNDSQDLLVTLPSRKGPAVLRLNPQTGQYRLQGDRSVVKSWHQAIATIDQRPARGQTARLVSVEEVKPETITRAVRLLQAARRGELPAQVRWGGDVVGIETQQAESAPGFVELKEAKPSTELAQAEVNPADDVAPGGEADEPTQVQVPLPGGEGSEGALTGPVQIDFVEGLDSIIIRGSKPDVARIIRIIEDIERLSAITEPSIELVPLKHVNSLSIAEIVTQLNSTALSARRGAVSITALVKPNALLLIGRPESVEATIKLIEKLDQPVAPESEFEIFNLKHMSALDAQQTVDTFYEERGGLGPAIQVQADFRTNSLIVYASPRDMQEVGRLIAEIDVEKSEAVDEIRVFKLKNALAEELAPVLQATLRGDTSQAGGGLGGQGQFGGQLQQQGGGQQFGGQNQGGLRGGLTTPRSAMLTLTLDDDGNKVLRSGILTSVRIAADIRANSLVVTAPTESMSLIAALVSRLDELPTSEATIKVFTILNGEASSLAEMLEMLFGEADQEGPTLQSATGAGDSSLVPLRFSTDLRTNSIIATGSAADLGVVEAILLRLDEDDISQRRSRVYRLQNAPANDVAIAINDFLRTEREVQLVAPEAISPFEQIEREVVVVPEVVSNSLIISATPRYFEVIAEIVQELDEQPPMVLIQVLIAEVDLGYAEEVGVELGLQDSLLFDRSAVFGDGLTGDELFPGFNFNNQRLGNAAAATSLATREKTAGQALTHFALSRTNDTLGYGGLVLSASSESVNLLIRALRESRRLDILSRPQVMTLNNQPAFILVGQRVPYIQGVQVLTSGQTITPTEFENVGLVLGVTPRISPEGLVVMEIDAEKSKLAPESEGVPISVDSDGNVLRQPPIDTTVAQTTVSARSGQTVILGGLITKETETVSRRVPYLADIPLVGDLFRFDSASELRTELLIIMTPHIVRNREESDTLNQVESERMSWCLADVVDIHGDADLSSGGIYRQGLTELIYPDLDPTGSGPVVPLRTEEVPTPVEAVPADIEPTTPSTNRSEAQPNRKLASRVGRWLTPKKKSQPEPTERPRENGEPRTDFVPIHPPENQTGKTSDSEYEVFILDDSGVAQPPTPDDSDKVAPASYLREKPQPESRWTKLRKKLKR